MNSPSPASFYRSAAGAACREAVSAERRAERISWTRLLLAALVVAALAAGDRWVGERGQPLLALAPAALFVLAVRAHGTHTARARAARQREAAAAAGLARIERRWDALPAWRAPEIAGRWPAVLARDLGVSGDRSLLRLLDVVHPAVGGRRVQRWLLDDPPACELIRARCESVVALRAAPELLLACAAEARHGATPASPRGIEAFHTWSVRGDLLPVSPAASAASAFVIAAVILAFLLGRPSLGAALVVPALAVQVTLGALARRRLERELPGVHTALAQISGVTSILAMVTGHADVTGTFGDIQRRLRATGSVASLRALERLLAWNEVRYSPMGHWLLNAVAGLDVHLARAVSSWRASHGAAAAAWLEDAADAEALLALGTLAFEHPAWSAPTVHDDAGQAPLRGDDVAHPLLDPATAVANAVMLAHAGDAILVSGSNMAGKTTFLRAVGLNVLLAQAGGVVCARSLAVRRCRVRSSVRVEDDLARGVSLFLAEVTRLRDVIRDAEQGDAPPVLFLFDEILHGTNAGDRRRATRAVMARLRDAGSFGLATTHDPAIGAARQLHFDGDVARDGDGALRLTFDYRARAGPAERANALQVLEMMGIEAGTD